MLKKIIAALMAGAMVLSTTACVLDAPTKLKKVTQSQKAKEAAETIKFTENAEIENIKRRLELTSDPGLLGFIVLFETGQTIAYYAVKGKVTSSGKRLTAPVQRWAIDRGKWSGSQLGPAPSDEGTWGSSNPYIYFWTINGEYKQWGGSGTYLYSDKPFRLNKEPVVVTVEYTNMQELLNAAKRGEEKRKAEEKSVTPVDNGGGVK